MDFVWIVLFGILALNEKSSDAIGLNALEVLGRFSLYSVLCVLGILSFILIGIIQMLRRKF